MTKPVVIVVGADKGGVGKTTVSRTLLDYFSTNNVQTRAFDTELSSGFCQNKSGTPSVPFRQSCCPHECQEVRCLQCHSGGLDGRCQRIHNKSSAALAKSISVAFRFRNLARRYRPHHDRGEPILFVDHHGTTAYIRRHSSLLATCFVRSMISQGPHG